MLPRPAIRFWSSSADFQAARAALRTAPPASGRRTPAPAARRRARRDADGVQRAGRGKVHEAEPARVVVGDDLSVIEMDDDMVVLRILRARDGEIRRRTRPRCGTSRTCRGARSASRRCRARIERDIWPAASGPRSACPSAARENAAGKGKRMSARRSSTVSIRAPTNAGASPRRTVSTSGSSGIGLHWAWSRITARKAAPYFCSLTAPTPWIDGEIVERLAAAPSPSRSASGRGR